MNSIKTLSLSLLRISLGWMLFYAGITKVLDPSWSAAGYIGAAKNFQGFYSWFLQPNILPTVDFLNEWGLTLIGISLLLGIMVRLSSLFGVALMLLYYFVLPFPRPDAHSLVVDSHVIYAAALLVLAYSKAGHAWGLERWCESLPLCARYPRLRALFS
ncbi:MAG: DoxX family membrane protein [bacterium]|nr:DoxX family membrane protein [bacterium]